MSDPSTGPYPPVILDHFLNPRNVGPLPGANGVGEVGAAAFGDVMRISLRIQDGRIAEARFQTYGCGAAIATSSIATELIRGLSVDQALQFRNQQILDALGGLPSVKAHCAVLVEEAIKAAVRDYQGRNPTTAPGAAS